MPKNRNGTDDPRNGLTLCRAHHWALDAGLFTLTADYAIVVSPLVQRADSRKFEKHGSQLDGRHRQVSPHPGHPTSLRCRAMVSST